MATSAKDPWRAVSVVPGKEACAAAQQLRDQRFLSRDAPRLPLPDCSNQAQCQCKYQKYGGRRDSLRRATDEGRYSPPLAPGAERRRPGERRERRR